MARKPISEKPMNSVERRKKSDSDKETRGEKRITAWLSVDATRALNLNLLRPENQDRGALQRILNDAVLQYKPKKTKA